MKFYLKLNSVILAHLLFSSTTFGQGKFKLTGYIDQQYNNATVTLRGSFKSHYNIYDSKVEHGKFAIVGQIENTYEQVFLTINNCNKSLNTLMFFITNKQMEIKIKNLSKNDSANKIVYRNIPFSDIQRKFELYIKPFENDYQNFNAKYSDFIYKNNKTNKSTVDTLMTRYFEIKNKLFDKTVAFIKANPTSYFSLHQFINSILPSTRLGADSLYKIYLNFSKQIRTSHQGNLTYAVLKRKQHIMLSKTSPDFFFITNDKVEYKLSQFRDTECVLICFWASWCGPCIRNIPQLRKLYELYASKGLQIISLSIDNNKDQWLASVEKFKMPWLQTCDLSFLTLNREIRKLYDINFVPQYFLINKKGVLVYSNTQLKDDDDYSILMNILDKELN